MSEPASILRIPGEIRNQIYSHLLILPDPPTKRRLGDPPLHPAILSTCSRLYQEGVRFLYGRNTFFAHPARLADTPYLRLYHNPIVKPALTSLITKYHLRIRLACDPKFTMWRATKAFTGMDELTIEILPVNRFHSEESESSTWSTLKLLEDIRGVRKARIYGSVTEFTDYARWLEGTMMADAGVTRVFVPQDKEEGTDEMVTLA